MKYFNFLKNKVISVPYNNDPCLIDKLNDFLVKPYPFSVYIYFAPNPMVVSAGRKFPNIQNYLNEDNLFDNKKFNKDLILTLKKAKKYGFKTNLLLNNVLLGLPLLNNDLKGTLPKIQNYLEKLNSKNLLDRVTISNPYLLELIDWEKLKNIEIKTSVNLQIKSSKSVSLINNISNFWLNRGIDCIEVQKDLLRDLKELKKIKKAINKNTKISIIVNEGCLIDCPYQMAHQLHAFSFKLTNRKTIDMEKSVFNIAKCKYITQQEPWRIFNSNWLLPLWLKHYEELVDEFKFTDRNSTTEEILYVIKAYTTGIYDKGNVCNLISLLKMEEFLFPECILPKTFFNDVIKKEISDDYYKRIWEKLIVYNRKKNKEPRVSLKGLNKKDLNKFIKKS